MSDFCITIINIESKILEDYIKNNPVKYYDFYGGSKKCSTLNKLLKAISDGIDAGGSGIDLLSDKGIIDNLVFILNGGDEEDDEDVRKEYVPLIEFIENNRVAIEQECKGEIISTSQYDDEAPIIQIIQQSEGNTNYSLLDLNEVELDEDVDDILDLTPKAIRKLIKKYASSSI